MGYGEEINDGTHSRSQEGTCMNPWDQLPPELLTDLYELTMAAGYSRESMFREATFSLFIRDYPPHRSYFVSADAPYFDIAYKLVE
jgi:hypothetical protein